MTTFTTPNGELLHINGDDTYFTDKKGNVVWPVDATALNLSVEKPQRTFNRGDLRRMIRAQQFRAAMLKRKK